MSFPVFHGIVKGFFQNCRLKHALRDLIARFWLRLQRIAQSSSRRKTWANGKGSGAENVHVDVRAKISCASRFLRHFYAIFSNISKAVFIYSNYSWKIRSKLLIRSLETRDSSLNLFEGMRACVALVVDGTTFEAGRLNLSPKLWDNLQSLYLLTSIYSNGAPKQERRSGVLHSLQSSIKLAPSDFKRRATWRQPKVQNRWKGGQ